MKPFPEADELIALFECEPELLDEDPTIPWAYNRVTFNSVRGHDQYVCVIEPANQILRFRWLRHGDETVDLDLNWVSGLTVEMEGGQERLTVHFRGSSAGSLILRLKPHFHLTWSTPVER